MQIFFRFAGYFGYAILMGLLLKFLFQYDQILLKNVQSTYNLFPYQVYSSLYPILLGVAFALPKFFRERRVDGQWVFDWIKMTTIGLPALFGSTMFLIYFSPLGIYLPSMPILAFSERFTTICGIVFGYVALSCLQKLNKKMILR